MGPVIKKKYCNKQTNEQKTLKNIKEKRNPKSEE